jgi:hypothetical protein
MTNNKRHTNKHLSRVYSRQELAKYGSCMEEVHFTGTYEQMVARMEDFARKEGGQVVRNGDGTVTWVGPDGAQVTLGMGVING